MPDAAGALDLELSERPPDGWADDLRRCGGGFFHSPTGIEAGAPAGRPVFVRARSGGATRGVAAGVASRCRVGPRTAHWYFPSLPALATGQDGAAVVRAIVGAARQARAAEVVFDSFDATWVPDGSMPEPRHAARAEFVVTLGDPADLLPRFAETHRRRARRGEKDGLTCGTAAGDAAAAALEQAQDGATSRARDLGRGFTAHASGLGRQPAPLSAPWGTAVFTGHAGETLMAAILTGWAGTRAYYIAGGSTAAGYERSASIWLHWTVMRAFAANGFATYNFGGVPETAASAEHPSHGLLRFKLGFGAQEMPVRGSWWTLRPGHLRLHRALGWLKGKRR